MAITAYPFDDQDTTENQFSLWARELQDSGVADTFGGTGFRVSGGGGGMAVQVQPGFAFLRGHALSSTAVETKTIEAASSALRYDRVVLRINPSTNLGSIEVLKGTAGSGVPQGLTQTAEGIFELSLAVVTVQANATTIDAAMVRDDRQYVGARTGVWSTATRPSGFRTYKLGFNTTTQSWEFWNGSQWQNVVASTAENSSQWNGFTLTVSTTQPAGTPTADRIWIQPIS
ncbi:hypothetical protein AB0J80_36095 [Actinoplanes sp. NPDC049548]|uniref:hypothetical protein n=1 Tax=Actinoplanes sp. NPDC049548 TaxID=3155152 RepID=UPI003412C49B